LGFREDPVNGVYRLYIPEGSAVQPLDGFQAKHLRGLAHGLKPLVFVGHRGITPPVIAAVREALDAHELIKVRFLDEKDREVKAQLAAQIARETESALAGMIGHTAIFYRRHPEPDRRRIQLPGRAPGATARTPGRTKS
jgi:RNA-binding protein